MNSKRTLLAGGCILLVVAGLAAYSLGRAGPRCHLTLTILGITNGPTPGSPVTLRLLNDGPRAVQVLPAYSVESQPPKVDPTMCGSLGAGIRTLRPGEAWTNSVQIPPLTNHTWRVGVSYWVRRSAPAEFGHYWLMQAGLAKREEQGFVAYTDWITNLNERPAHGDRR